MFLFVFLISYFFFYKTAPGLKKYFLLIMPMDLNVFVTMVWWTPLSFSTSTNILHLASIDVQLQFLHSYLKFLS